MNKILNSGEISKRLREELPYLRDRYGVRRLALYGSFANGKPGRTSDIDILVELARPLGFDFIRLADHMEVIFGRKVDLATFESLKRSLKDPLHRHIALNIKRSLKYVQAKAG